MIDPSHPTMTSASPPDPTAGPSPDRPPEKADTAAPAAAPPATDPPPDFWRNLRQELRLGRQWRDRAVVLLFAAITGLVVVGFTAVSELAVHAYQLLRSGELFGGSLGLPAWLAAAAMLLWTPALTVAVLWWTRRFAAGAGGGGIPQVMAALDDTMPTWRRQALVSLKLALHKIGLVTGGLFAGLSIGREGPTVQVGAGVMLPAKRFLSAGSNIDEHDLMVAGAAAGIAAAFNTPLGGVIFAMEQLTRRRSSENTSTIVAAIVLAGLIAVSVFGNLSYFGTLRVQRLDWGLLGPGLAVALVAGLAGGLFSRLIVASAQGLPDRFSHWRRMHPLRFAAGCALGVALINMVTAGATAGAGYEPTRALLEGEAELPAVYTVLKFCATWLSIWTGVPAGSFAPSLAIGAGIGQDIAWLTGVDAARTIPLIALGMVGFLAATTQGPITAFIIVMEMVAGQSMVLSLMATALLSSGVARLVTRPMYLEQAAMLWTPLRQPTMATEPRAVSPS